MKRCIYVGKDDGFLNHGITGEVQPWSGTLWSFYPDRDVSVMKWCVIVPGSRIYIPSEDQTRHCVKP